MSVELNHTIVWASDSVAAARFLADLLGRPAPVRFGPFEVVALDNGASLDFAISDGLIQSQHIAILISEAEFDAVFCRIKAQRLDYWSDPMRRSPDEINHHDGGRGVYFEAPDGHFFEVITKPYGGDGS